MRLNSLSLTARIFLALLATTIVVVAAAGVATRLSFTHGFLGYLNELAVVRMEAITSRAARAYAEHGDWEFIRQDRRQWWEIIRPVPGLDMPAGAADDRTPPVSDLTGVVMRMALLDDNRNLVAGFLVAGAESIERPVMSGGRTVGWVSLAQFESVASAGAERFENAQTQAMRAIGLLAMILAAAIAWWFARTLLAPVRRIADATHQLAGGDYALRVPVTSRDEIGRLGRDFNHLAETLQRNEQMRRNFLADLSHELRTPLGVLHGELEALEDGVRKPDQRAIRSLQAEVSLLNKLVSDLYDLSLADVGALAYRKVDVDVRQPLSLAIDAFRERLQQHGIALETDIAAAPLLAFADPRRLQQLFKNLLENSCRYTDVGGTLQIVAGRRDDMLEIAFTDSAPGVTPERLGHLFDRFYRVEESRNRASGGAGLGLAICASIIRAHDGVIVASDSPLGGLRLLIRLPASAQEKPG